LASQEASQLALTPLAKHWKLSQSSKQVSMKALMKISSIQ